MSEAKFTKGPWAAFQNEVGSWEVNCRESEGSEIGRYSPTVCSLWSVTYTKLENKLQEPNAHLIAVAPEMYNYLEMLSGQLTDINASHAVKEIETLLAKARGEK